MAIDLDSTAPAATTGADAPAQLAGWWTRAAAWLLDGLVVGAVFFAIGLVVGAVLLATGHKHIDRTTANTLSLVLGIPLGLCYAPLLLCRAGARNGQTLGKQAMRLRVVHDSGEPIDLRIGLRREVIGRQIPIILTWGIYGLFDYLWPLGQPQNRCLHDKLAKTRVVRIARTPAPPTPLAHRPAPAPAPAEPDAPPVRGDWLPPSAGG